jgi:hypothetical protein
MPRSVKLSWQAGAKGSGRTGRWRRKYKGQIYYFPGGRGKTDQQAYDAAVAAWEAEKLNIDREAPRPHQRDHEAAIDQWEQVLAWCNRHGDREHAEIAAKKLEGLRKRLKAPILRKLDREDWFEAQFDSPLAGDPAWRSTLEKMVEEHDQWLAALPVASVSVPVLPTPSLPAPALPAPSGSATLIEPNMDLDGSPRRIERAVWRDRLEVQKLKAASEDESLHTHVERFIGRQEKHGHAGQVSAGRVRATKLHLSKFKDWLGKDTAVGEIDEQVLEGFHAYLLDKVSSRTWSGATASDCMASVKSFVRWLWLTKVIPTLPRILDGKATALKIVKPAPKVVTFTKNEITTLLADASDRTKLYLLLMLNCAHTQKDISDLQVTEVDWTEGRIIRRRSKTADCENVPTVNYKLWPATLRLLKQERSANSKDHVLLNANGSPIWSEEITKEGGYKKSDNIKSAFDRLQKKVGITKPLKSLKKTSASLLRDNGKFSALASLFLGHAPRSMSDRHYTQVPQNLFDQAILWLGQEYSLIAPAVAAKAEESAAKPSESVAETKTDVDEPAPRHQSNTRSHRTGRRSKAVHAVSAAFEPARDAADSGR